MKKTKSQNSSNPNTRYFHGTYPKQTQPYPGIEAKMTPRPDCGEDSYIGNGLLAGKRALITGGDSGIGRAVAIAFAREGADVAISFMSTEDKDAYNVAEYIEAAGQRAFLFPGDISNEKFARKMVNDAARKLGGLDTLVLNAGFQQAVPDILKLTTEQLRKTFEINLFSMFWMVQAALPYLKPGATIITTTSIEAFKPGENLLDYAASKAAIMAFTRSLAKQLVTRGIRVNGVAPGPIWTALQVSGGQLPKDIPSFGKDTPMKRAGQPAELAATYVLLASDRSTYTTAEIYGITGGDHTF